jgi:hypothetical protein
MKLTRQLHRGATDACCIRMAIGPGMAFLSSLGATRTSTPPQSPTVIREHLSTKVQYVMDKKINLPRTSLFRVLLFLGSAVSKKQHRPPAGCHA